MTQDATFHVAAAAMGDVAVGIFLDADATLGDSLTTASKQLAVQLAVKDTYTVRHIFPGLPNKLPTISVLKYSLKTVTTTTQYSLTIHAIIILSSSSTLTSVKFFTSFFFFSFYFCYLYYKSTNHFYQYTIGLQMNE